MMFQRHFSLATVILATLFYTNALQWQPQFTIKAEKNKEFDESCLIGTFKIESGRIADCLQHCLENCLCQSFQICQNTECQLCSSNQKENSSLLHKNGDCVYAMYEMQHLEGNFQKLNEQCSGMSCSMKYNCCQQPGLCPDNKICKSINSLAQPWKRFTCECPGGYHGDNRDERAITSCQGYSNRSLKSGVYKVQGSDMSVYEAYCHFDSHSAWTLVQSYSFANGSRTGNFEGFRKALSEDHPVNEMAPTWSGYRLSKARMRSIKNRSDFLQFTCDYEKNQNREEVDYLRISFKDIRTRNSEEITDVIELDKTPIFSTHHGTIGGKPLNQCYISLHQSASAPFHVHVLSSCKLLPNNSCFIYFGNYDSALACLDKTYRCVENGESTTQLWFGNYWP